MKCTVSPRLCAHGVVVRGNPQARFRRPRPQVFGGRRGGFLLAFLLAIGWANAVGAAAPRGLAELHQADLRLATITDRLLAANAPLCRQTMPLTGMLIHSQDQYGQSATAALSFANGRIAIEGIVAGSAAAAAGLQAGEGLLEIAGVDLRGLLPQGKSPARDAAFDILAAEPPTEPLRLLVARAGHEWSITLAPVSGCRALVEVLADGGRVARSDGRVIQVSYSIVAEMSDDALAAIVAHELAHAVLEHRRRLSAAGVSKGFFGEFGGNRRRNRQAEVEADLLSVHLLANAGLDAQAAPRLWRSREGRSLDAGIFRSGAYPSPEKRAEAMEAEIASYLAPAAGSARAGLSRPAHLLDQRDQPF